MGRSLFDAENFPSFNKPWIRMLMGELYSPRETHFVWAVCDVHDCEEYDFLYTRWGFLITRIPQTHVKRLGSVPVVMGFLQLHPHLLYHSGWWLFFFMCFTCILLYFTVLYCHLHHILQTYHCTLSDMLLLLLMNIRSLELRMVFDPGLANDKCHNLAG